jgi:CrcB protein
MVVLGIALAGAVGAPARYLVDRAVLERTGAGLPAGTLLINVVGSFLLGVLTGLALYHAFPSMPRTILGTGFCGAFTTFSTFAYEVVRLAEQGRRGAAVRTLLAGVVLPTLAAALGLALAAL